MDKLSKEVCKTIYNDWKDKKLDLDKMIAKYCVDPKGYVYFRGHLWKRGHNIVEIEKKDY